MRRMPRSRISSVEIASEQRKEFVPTLFLYDNYPGGIGLSAGLYDLRNEVVTRAAELVSACECTFGCPAYVGPILASDETHRYSPKTAAVKVLALLGGNSI